MQRLNNIDKWFAVEDGKAISFENVQPRRMRLDVNAPSPVCLYYASADGEVFFLARVDGRDCVEYGAIGEHSVTVEGGACWMATVDGEDFSFSIPDAKILTKLVERRPRNPELEMMQHMMNRNIDARLAAQRHELEELWARRERAARAAAAKPAPASDEAGSAGKPTPAVGADTSAPKDEGADVAAAAGGKDKK